MQRSSSKTAFSIIFVHFSFLLNKIWNYSKFILLKLYFLLSSGPTTACSLQGPTCLYKLYPNSSNSVWYQNKLTNSIMWSSFIFRQLKDKHLFTRYCFNLYLESKFSNWRQNRHIFLKLGPYAKPVFDQNVLKMMKSEPVVLGSVVK